MFDVNYYVVFSLSLFYDDFLTMSMMIIPHFFVFLSLNDFYI